MTQINYAYLCMNCDEICDCRELAQGNCPRCGSRAVYPLKKWMLPLYEIKKSASNQEETG